MLVPLVTFAHVFGQTYTLPVPLWLFLFGAGAAVAVSFAVIGLLAGEKPAGAEHAAKQRGFGITADIGRFLGVLLLAVTIITGFSGVQNSLLNFSVTFFWVIFLLGFTYVTAIFGNFWELINPFKVITEGMGRIRRRSLRPRAYPARLSYWPALLSFYGLIWIELVGSGFGTSPHDLAILVIVYTVMTLAGIYWFGSEAWFKYGELFSVFFGIVAKLSPVRISGRMFSVRRPLDGLAEAHGATFSLLLFILFMLASTGFDGLKETAAFGNFVGLLPSIISGNSYVVGTLGLALAPLVLLVAYLASVALMKRMVSTKLSVWQLAYRFSFSLVPIAVAYHAAHYFTMLLITGQGIIPELSDPFGTGLNLFGTADYSPTIGFLSASVVWYAEVALIVVGHIGAVYVAHRETLKLFSSPSEALRSQLPMVVLMVLYTVGSLWIIAQPIAV